jgi:hypothetical protein
MNRLNNSLKIGSLMWIRRIFLSKIALINKGKSYRWRVGHEINKLKL